MALFTEEEIFSFFSSFLKKLMKQTKPPSFSNLLSDRFGT